MALVYRLTKRNIMPHFSSETSPDWPEGAVKITWWPHRGVGLCKNWFQFWFVLLWRFRAYFNRSTFICPSAYLKEQKINSIYASVAIGKTMDWTFSKTRKCHDTKQIDYNESPVSLRHAKINDGFPTRKETGKLKLNTRTSVKASPMKRYKITSKYLLYSIKPEGVTIFQ